MAIATLSIDLVAKLANLERDMGRAARIADQNAKRMEKAFSGVGKAIAAIGSVVAVGQITGWIKGVADAADGLSKLSQRTGIAVEDLSALNYAASLNDATFADLERGFKGLSTRMLAAQSGSKEAAAAFAALNISVTDSAGNLRAVDQVMLDIADAFAGMEDGAGKAAIANKLMEESGLRLIPTLNNGRAGLAEMRKEAEGLGAIMGDDLARASVELNDNLARMSALSQGLAAEIGGPLISSLNELAKEFLDARRAGLTFMEALVGIGLSDPSKGPAEQIARITAELEKLRSGKWYEKSLIGNVAGDKMIAQLEKELAYWRSQLLDGGFNDSNDRRRGGTSRPAPLLASAPRTAGFARPKTEKADDDLGDFLKDLESRIKPAQDALERFRAIQLDASVAGADLTKSERQLFDLMNSPEWQGMAEPWRDLVREQFEAANAAERTAAEQSRLNDLLAATPTEQLERTRETMQFLADAFERGAISAEQFNEAASAALGNTADKAKETLDVMDEFSKNAARGMQESLSDFLFDPFADGLEGMVKGFGKTIQRMVADAVAADLARRLFGADGGGGGWIGQAATFAASFFADGGVMTSDGPVPLRKYATGGIANSPQLAMFGEGSTPEAYVPLPDGRNIPVKMQGGGSTVINVNVASGTPAEVRRAAASGAREALGFMSNSARYA